MNPQQKKYWAVLEFIDELGTGLERNEIDFVANLIDNNHHGKLEPSDIEEIKRLLCKRAGGWKAYNAFRDNVVAYRSTQE